MYFLTTMHIGERVGNPVVKRRQADGSQADVSCPPCLPDYQKYMRGVDKGNYYNIGRKSRKWWHHIFVYCLEVCIMNYFCMEKLVSYGEYQQRGRKKRKGICFHFGLSLQRS